MLAANGEIKLMFWGSDLPEFKSGMSIICCERIKSI